MTNSRDASASKNNKHTSVTESDEPLADNVKNFGNMFQRPRFETMHQVLLPENFDLNQVFLHEVLLPENVIFTQGSFARKFRFLEVLFTRFQL